ncbi:DUF861 domain-containing protein [Maribius pontilimi]|uniref:DUF861 domain-containing protein n=1 Tax=Palleronia pontilimi TaxID=1964209 RepID=A0A934ICT2_9RHOB|nr:cupin domain-containing protein [Palleronia pontilimi]MBJ3761155.1 DUF861 domain-containing protein [Palleronia pontilimi]
MDRYAPGCDVGPLEPWGFDTPDSAYVIVAGDPRVSGRLDMGGPGQPTRAGIWRCTVGTFDCTELGDELMTVLSGRCVLHDLDTGTRQALGPGDSLLIDAGKRVRWEVTEEITKVFFGYRAAGF